MKAAVWTGDRREPNTGRRAALLNRRAAAMIGEIMAAKSIGCDVAVMQLTC